MKDVTIKRKGQGLDQLVLILKGYMTQGDRIRGSNITSVIPLLNFEEIAALVANASPFEREGPVPLVLGGKVWWMEAQLALTIYNTASDMLFDVADYTLELWEANG